MTTTTDRYFHLGTDGLLHGVLTINGHAQSFCDTPLAPDAGTAPVHTDCMMVELSRLHHRSTSGEGEKPFI
ncbi:hypothetical protein [Allobranchiibius huperziae]|uniref:Uncharacterized protein n=1 Tax=Allobranchiibius huperziae TaxID=1874116 RepID=A0A853DG16_9MICO|nr:hypothetical protein [Allobranchiibius huperziae]NYJ76472.1 hypothetical protein [Allobranchiibius huperziae]